MIEEIIKFVQARTYVTSHISNDNVGVKFEIPLFEDTTSIVSYIVDAMVSLNYERDFKIITNKKESAIYLELF